MFFSGERGGKVEKWQWPQNKNITDDHLIMSYLPTLNFCQRIDKDYRIQRYQRIPNPSPIRLKLQI